MHTDLTAVAAALTDTPADILAAAADTVVNDYDALRAGRRVMRCIPAGGIEVPVKGISFRGDLFPENIYRLREVIRFAESLTEDRWAIKMLRRGDFRETVAKVLEDGKLPCTLGRDRDNPHDPLAVTVWCPFLGDYGFLGYLPAKSHGCPNVAVAHQLDDDPRPGGHPAFGCWVSKVRVHPDHLDAPGIDVKLRPWRPRPAAG